MSEQLAMDGPGIDSRARASATRRIAVALQSDGPGGAETMVLRLSQRLREASHTVIPVTPVGGVGWLGEQYRQADFAPESVRISHRWIDPVFLKDLIGIVRRHSIQVVHSHEFEMAVYGTAACRIAGIPHVITMHGGLTVWKAWQRRVALRWAMRNSAATVVVSEATREQFARDLSVPASKFRVVPNGVPIKVGDASAPRQEFGCRAGDVVLLAVGNLERNKGHRELIEALAQLEGSTPLPPWKLIIAGGRGGPEHESLLELVASRGLRDKVHIATGRSDIPNLQALADIFVMPSLWEGMPMALLEAMVAGNPVVASRTGGIPEAIEHMHQGLLVPPGDVGALAANLGRLIQDAALRATMGESARARGMTEFSVSAMASRYESLYEEAIRSAER